MGDLDLNLIPALHALLSEGSVTGAARRLGLSVSATSRTLTRLRATLGDPLLVRAGRGLVPTPRALVLQDQVRRLMEDAAAVLRPAPNTLDVASLERSFTVRSGEGFVHLFGGKLVAAVAEAAPGVCLRFVPKPLKHAAPLREGDADLEIGTPGLSAPEMRTLLLFRDRFIGLARAGHGLFGAPITPARFAACRHVSASRRGAAFGPIDDALATLGLRRQVAAVVPGFPDAVRVAAETDLVAAVPATCLGFLPPADTLRGFDLPVQTPPVTVSAFWHPRLHADPAQRWFRDVVRRVCSDAGPGLA